MEANPCCVSDSGTNLAQTHLQRQLILRHQAPYGIRRDAETVLGQLCHGALTSSDNTKTCIFILNFSSKICQSLRIVSAVIRGEDRFYRMCSSWSSGGPLAKHRARLTLRHSTPKESLAETAASGRVNYLYPVLQDKTPLLNCKRILRNSDPRDHWEKK